MKYLASLIREDQLGGSVSCTVETAGIHLYTFIV